MSSWVGSGIVKDEGNPTQASGLITTMVAHSIAGNMQGGQRADCLGYKIDGDACVAQTTN